MAKTPTRKAPGLRQLLPLPYGLIPEMRRDPLGFLAGGVRRFGDVFRYQIGPWSFYVLSRPEHVKHVLQDRWANYPRSFLYRFARLVGGDGLVTSEGDEWRRQRRTIQPAFNAQRVDAMAGAMVAAAGEMLDRWASDYAPAGREFDLMTQTTRLTLAIVGRTLMGVDLGGVTDAIGPIVTEALGYLEHRMANLVSAPLWVPTPRNVRFRRAMRTLDDIVHGIIVQRRQNPDGGADLISLLLAARDPETGQAMTDREIRDQVHTFMGAGHETSAVALAWTFAMLGQHPEIHAAVRAEAVAVLGDHTPTAADVPALALTQRVIRETMRLYPPVYAVARDVAQTDEIAGFTIPRKSTVIVSPYLTQRHPDVWPDPEKFDPDRFTPERTAGRPRFAYFPFLGGPHQCIGEHFAMIEMTLVVAMIVRRFHVELSREGPIIPKPLLATRPGGGVWIRVK